MSQQDQTSPAVPGEVPSVPRRSRRSGLGPSLPELGPSKPPVRPPPLPGYLCEVCLDASATQMRYDPTQGEQGICDDCLVRAEKGAQKEHADD
jgi:hypothetical protein